MNITESNDTESPLLLQGTAADTYWTLARQPLNCLIFLLPLLLTYEMGVLCLGGQRGELFRNGADLWLRCGLQQAGCSQAYLLPVLVVAGLLGWQIAGRYPWKVSTDTLFGMLTESLLFAFCLVLMGQAQDVVFRQYLAISSSADVPLSLSVSPLPRVIAFLGAGVYEEVLFRLCLLPACYGALRLLLLPARPATVLAVLITSTLFSAAHYIGPGADQFALFSFTFRLLAGLFFAVLFVLRGFGITVGCHAAYDLLVGVLLQFHRA